MTSATSATGRGLLRRAKALVGPIGRRGRRLRRLSDRELKDLANTIRDRVREKPARDADLVDWFALVREVARRTMSKAHYDEQLIAGILLSRGAIAEMATGEGKTLSTSLPASWLALGGEGVHVMTVNAYLAERDYAELAPVYRFLGLTVGLNRSGDSAFHKREAYRCDITYGVGSEFGFDYLRDQVGRLAAGPEPLGTGIRSKLRDRPAAHDPVQRALRCAIVDEADSIMIDEAGSALILSGSTGAPAAEPEPYRVADRVAQELIEGKDFLVERRERRLALTRDGAARAITKAVAPSVPLVRPWLRYVEQALRARHLFEANIDYLVTDGRIQIIDPHTGRRSPDRTWSEGLHQAVEAVAGVTITSENATLARISRQRYFSLYESLSGTTGTTDGLSEEFEQVYEVPVAPVPLRHADRRRRLPARFFPDIDAKWRAIVEDVAAAQGRGQPVLVGTASVAESEALSTRLDAAGVVHVVLNARQDADEAAIIAEAGQSRRVTVATGIAGRGSDIVLGPGVDAAGGLYVIVASPAHSTRIDRQLIGRCARQGDRGTYRCYACAQDKIIADDDGPLARRLWAATRSPEALAKRHVNDLADRQRRLENAAREGRRQVLALDRWRESIMRDAGAV